MQNLSLNLVSRVKSTKTQHYWCQPIICLSTFVKYWLNTNIDNPVVQMFNSKALQQCACKLIIEGTMKMKLDNQETLVATS